MRMIIMLSSLLGLFACKGYTDLTSEAFQRMLAEKGAAQLLDVRTPEEFAGGRIAGAVNMDWNGGAFDAAKLDPARPVMVYCRSGRRSASAASELCRSGFKEVYNLTGGILAWTEAGLPTTRREVERFCSKGGEPVEITLIEHASLAISWRGMSIQVDPVSKLARKTDYAAEFPRADLILVTHEHFDHFDPQAIQALRDGKTRLVTNARCAEKLGWGTAMANGEATDIGDIHIEAVPAYKTTPWHIQFNPKGRDNGFILTLDGLRIYIAGDTEDIPEMADIKDIDVAFLPCNQPYTMTVDQCVAAAKVIAPRVLIPYHFSQTDISALPSRLPGIDVRLRQMQ